MNGQVTADDLAISAAVIRLLTILLKKSLKHFESLQIALQELSKKSS